MWPEQIEEKSFENYPDIRVLILDLILFDRMLKIKLAPSIGTPFMPPL